MLLAIPKKLAREGVLRMAVDSKLIWLQHRADHQPALVQPADLSFHRCGKGGGKVLILDALVCQLPPITTNPIQPCPWAPLAGLCLVPGRPQKIIGGFIAGLCTKLMALFQQPALATATPQMVSSLAAGLASVHNGVGCIGSILSQQVDVAVTDSPGLAGSRDDLWRQPQAACLVLLACCAVYGDRALLSKAETIPALAEFIDLNCERPQQGGPASPTITRLKGLALLLYTEIIDIDDDSFGVRQTSSSDGQNSAALSCPQQFLNIVIERSGSSHARCPVRALGTRTDVVAPLLIALPPSPAVTVLLFPSFFWFAAVAIGIAAPAIRPEPVSCHFGPSGFRSGC